MTTPEDTPRADKAPAKEAQAACCSPEEQDSCCDLEHKTECCGAAMTLPHRCGCGGQIRAHSAD